MTPDEQQRDIRERTIEAKDSNIKDNPVTIDMSELLAAGGGEMQRKRLRYKNPMKRGKVTNL
jgi:hypothetical protein